MRSQGLAETIVFCACGRGATRESFFVYWTSEALNSGLPSRGNDMAAQHVPIFLTACSLLLAAASAGAQEIYRWVDQSGVVHFSDTAPASVGADVSTVFLEETRSPDYDPEEDIYNVAAQAERMQALRVEMAEGREARRERQRDAAQSPAEQDREVVRYGYDYGYPWRPRPPARPPNRPRPPVPEPYTTSTLRPPGQPQDR